MEGVIDSLSSVTAPAREKKKNSLLPGLSPPLPLIYDPKMAFTVKKKKTGFVYACLYVLRVEKGKVVKSC